MVVIDEKYQMGWIVGRKGVMEVRVVKLGGVAYQSENVHQFVDVFSSSQIHSILQLAY